MHLVDTHPAQRISGLFNRVEKRDRLPVGYGHDQIPVRTDVGEHSRGLLRFVIGQGSDATGYLRLRASWRARDLRSLHR